MLGARLVSISSSRPPMRVRAHRGCEGAPRLSGRKSARAEKYNQSFEQLLVLSVCKVHPGARGG